MIQLNQGALRGIRVLDLSRVLGGPYCTQILGDHGADVIKIEPPDGDETRTWGPPFHEGSAAYFEGANRNKRSMTLDLNQPADRQRLLVLLQDADVLVQNFKPRSLLRWGLHPEQLQANFPALVHCWINGFGEHGPLGGLPGYDAAIQAMTGLLSVNGERGGAPLRLGVPIIDLVTGINAALGIVLALRDRERTGQGQVVESALFDNGLSLLHPFMANYFRNGHVPEPAGSAHPNITPYDSFRTRNGLLFLAVGNNSQFQTLCSILGVGELAQDVRFASNDLRSQHREALKTELETQLASFDAQTIADDLLRLGVPCSAVNDIQQALQHSHTKHRGMVVEMDDYQGIASPIKLERSQASYRLPPPRQGEQGRQLSWLPTEAGDTQGHQDRRA